MCSEMTWKRLDLETRRRRPERSAARVIDSIQVIAPLIRNEVFLLRERGGGWREREGSDDILFLFKFVLPHLFLTQQTRPLRVDDLQE